jgi:VCBS repeat protein/FG-GAP repeat protein
MTKPIVKTFEDNATDNGLQQDSGVVAATPVGDFYAVWRDSGNFNSGHADIVGRHFDTFGNPIGNDVSLLPLNNAFGVPFNASQPATVALPIAGQADGTATAFTDNFNNGPDFDVYVVRTDASLNRLANPLLIDGSTSVANDPSVTSFADGSLVVSYTLQNSTTDWDIMARTVSAAGVVGPVITLFNDTDRSDLSDLATLKNGNFVAVFESPFLGSPTDLDSFFTIKTENGTNVVSPTTVVGAGSTATETNPHVAALAGGGFVVTWTDSAGDENGTSQGIRATVYDASGNVVPSAADILVNQFNQAGTQGSNDVTALPDGGFEVVWEDIASGVDRVQRFDATGHLIGLPVTISNLATFDVNAATLTNERSIYTVNDFSSGNNNTDSSILLNPQSNDFNGDGASDILWHNDNGQAAIWEMSGTSQIPGGSQVLAANPGPSWTEAGSGDFNADGHSDILWQNANGQVAIWDMNGSNIIGGGTLGLNAGPGWKAVESGDFNGDGLSDILFQNTDNGQPAIWEMNGTNVIGGGVVSANPGPGWTEVGTGDFNGDGHSDILWQNANGQVAIWEMNGSNIIGGGALSLNAGPGWKAVGSGDFNGDGLSDILFQNTGNGQPAIWEMNGTNVIGGGVVSSVPGASWSAIGTGDFNGDGHSDILWRNTDGQAAIWEMNGFTQIPGGSQVLAADPGPTWHPVRA